MADASVGWRDEELAKGIALSHAKHGTWVHAPEPEGVWLPLRCEQE